MGKFLTGNVEQLDLALEHLSEGDPNNARFALMLVDNVVEITLHKHAENRRKLQRMSSRHAGKPEDPLLAEALGRRFDHKLKYAKSTDLVGDAEMAQSIETCHGFRNQVYHVGIQHEAILPALASFYFDLACDVFGRYSPNGLSWGSNLRVPERAAKYFSREPMLGEHQQACLTLKAAASAFSPNLAQCLAAHMEDVIDENDNAINFLANEGPVKMSRDEVIVDCQAWTFFTSDEAKAFAAANGCPEWSVGGFVDWLKANYSWPLVSDPIPSWQRRRERVHHEQNSHKALQRYCSFMDQTAEIRDKIDQLAHVLDSHIDEQIERARGN